MNIEGILYMSLYFITILQLCLCILFFSLFFSTTIKRLIFMLSMELAIKEKYSSVKHLQCEKSRVQENLHEICSITFIRNVPFRK